ncbi:MAG TPA: Fe-S cluster assembly protein SufD, partial [Chroococcidiopsis sp.]
ERMTVAPLSAAAQTRQAFLAHLLAVGQRSPLTVEWLSQWRDRATVRVKEQTIPSSRDEEWRFTDLSALLAMDVVEAAPVSVSAADIAEFILPEAAHSRLVWVDGRYAAELSDVTAVPDGVAIGNLASLSAEQQSIVQRYLATQPGAEEVFTALNTASLADVAVVIVPKSVAIAPPIHLLQLSTGTATSLQQPRTVVIAEVNSALTLVEDYVGLGETGSFTNTVTEIWVGENAQVHHTRVQRAAQAAVHIGKTAVSQARDSRYAINAIELGAALSRHHLEVYQTGEQTETILNGLTLISGDQVSDTHSAIALSKPYGRTNQLHKCIIDDRGHAIFNGKVSVPRAAQQTDAAQLNRNLLLSPKARVDTKPQLEIVADNVKCSHGAAVGQLEADEMFYLQSRGIDAASARQLLIYAFAYEILAQIPVPSLQQALTQAVAAKT